MINKAPQLTFVYDRYRNATPSRKASVELRVYHNYKQKYISTGVMLYPSQWKNGKIVNCPDALHISQILDRILREVRQVILDMMNTGNIDIFLIPERLEGLYKDKGTFLDFCKERAVIRKYGKQKDTKERYDRFLRLFEKWGGIVEFGDINDQKVIAYDKYLDSSGMKPYSKWNNYHRFLNSFIMDAIDEGLLSRNPYKWVNIDRDKDSDGLEKYLTLEEFRAIRSAPMPTQCLERVRDVFVFQTYTCMSYSDLRSIETKNIKEVKGTSVYTGNRHKTGKAFVIPILPPALDILAKYNGKLPIISNVKYNEYLKVVAQAAGVDKPVSTHWARHTGATLLLNEGVPMQIVSRICGHSSTRITEQVYAKLLDETVVDALSDIDI